MDLDNSIANTLNEIQKTMNTNSIIGKPISTKDKIIIPISKTALGFGIGVANNNGNSSTELGGAGGGGSIDPVALLIVYTNISGPDGVQLINIDQANNPLDEVLSGIGKMAFDLLGNSDVKPATEVKSENTVDKIKTKIKTNKNINE